MTRKWREDLSRSARQFMNIVWPEISREWFNEDTIAPVEAVSEEEFADQLDQISGIDYWVIETEKGMRGVATRVQNYTDMSTFTIRESRDTGGSTEYQKRLYAIRHGYLYPYWTIQSYVRGGVLENAAIVRTDDLIKYIDRGELGVHYGKNRVEQHGAGTFFYVHWEDLGEFYDVRWLRKPNESLRLKPEENLESQRLLIDF